MTDRRTVFTIVCLIGALSCFLYGAAVYLIGINGADAVPDALWLAAGNASGALITLLSSTKSGPASAEGESTPVTVTNTEADPVPVDAGYTRLELLTFVLVVMTVTWFTLWLTR